MLSKLDLCNTYHLVCIRAEYLALPFILNNKSAVFQALENDVLLDFLNLFIFVYLDDIQNRALLKLLSRLGRVNFTCSQSVFSVVSLRNKISWWQSGQDWRPEASGSWGLPTSTVTSSETSAR